MSTTKKRAELKRLSNDHKGNLFAMLRLAAEIVADPEYVDQFGGEAGAMDDLEAKEFSHFGGNPSLGAMLAAYRKNPDEKTWRDYGYNLRAMIDLANPKEPSETVRVDWKAKAKELEAELANVKAQAADQSKTISELRSKVDEMNGLAGELRGQIKELRGRRERAEA